MPPRGRGKKSSNQDRENVSNIKQEKVQCSVCKDEMGRNEFEKHNYEKHNRLSWIEGDEPLDMKDEKLILRILNQVLKSKRKKILCCDTCSEEKKSALGYLTHKLVCGKTAEEKLLLRVTCELCGRTMMPVSVRSHALLHERNAIAEESSSSVSETKASRASAARAKTKMSKVLDDEADVQFMQKRKFRKVLPYSRLDSVLTHPTFKLLQTWKEIIDKQGVLICLYKDCSYEAENVDEMKNHAANCECFSNHDMMYLCNLCLYQCKDESQIAMHIQSEHFDDGSDASCGGAESSSEEEPGSEDESERNQSSRNRSTKSNKTAFPLRNAPKMKFLLPGCMGYGKELDIYLATLHWTFEFRQKNYSKSLFPLLHTSGEDWKLVKDEANRYLPITRISVSTETQSLNENQAQRFSLFESNIVEGVSTMFVGGPVWAMDWCPIPMEECLSNATMNEYLAVSSHHSMDDFFLAQKCYSSRNVIQIWNCGPLDRDRPLQPAEFALALAHDFGTVWCLAWCPSGVYGGAHGLDQNNIKLKRLGVLAAACSDGTVRIFSVPFPEELKAHQTQSTRPVYKCRPALTLVTNFPEPSQCTRVSWYQGKNHRLLAGSFCNGMVALWNLENLAPLLWDEKRCTLRPFHSFQAHLTVVTALSFSPELNGRFLMTGSHDRAVKFWDLEDTSNPVSLHRRGMVTDGMWLSPWISSLTAYDDALLHEHTNSTLYSIREYGYKPYPLLVQNSVAWSLSYSEWTNAVAQGSEAGEIVVNFPNQLLQGLDNEKTSVDKRILMSYTVLKELQIGNDGKERQGDVVVWTPSNSKGKSKKSSKNAKTQNQACEEETHEQVASNVASADVFNLKPRSYKDTQKRYGISINDIIKGRMSKSKLPAEALSRVRLSGRMQVGHSDMYPITSINKVSWNPNIGRFLWLASGHHCGLVRLIGAHFMESSTVTKFLSHASKNICKS